MDDYKETLHNLQKHDQEHLLTYYNELEPAQKTKLISDLKKLDLQNIADIRQQSMNLSSHGGKLDSKMHPIPQEQFGSVTRSSRTDVAKWEKEGLKKISEGKVAVLLLAGGQGTRLGVKYPKGMYNVGTRSQKTLYQIKAERIRRLQDLAYERTGKKGIIPWYIMTSEATMSQTKEFFDKHDYFGLLQKNVVFFEQSTLPCLDFNGKIFLSEKHKIAAAPDGNGGLYKALVHWNILDDMDKRGIECTHVHCVDNILIRMADPVFIGFCSLHNADCGAKVVEKSSPTESVGVVCRVGEVYQVVEYSEVSEETAKKRDESGRLVFNAGNICNHYFTVPFLKTVCSLKDLPHHVAKKKIPHIDPKTGEKITPTTPNGIKMEKFVFDVFQFSKNFVVLDVPREDEFSPLKNAEGADSCSPRHSRWTLSSLHHRRLVEAGGTIVDENGVEIKPLNGVNQYEGEYPVVCEISPLLSYDGEGLEKFVKGKTFRSPVILSEDLIKNGNGNVE
ncbi:UDP-N-acetylhexosamine pyrophosphorylase [Ciona intestinalis]